jgi:hypothetical protein
MLGQGGVAGSKWWWACPSGAIFRSAVQVAGSEHGVPGRMTRPFAIVDHVAGDHSIAVGAGGGGKAVDEPLASVQNAR